MAGSLMVMAFPEDTKAPVAAPSPPAFSLIECPPLATICRTSHGWFSSTLFKSGVTVIDVDGTRFADGKQ